MFFQIEFWIELFVYCIMSIVDFDEIFGLLEQQHYSGYFTVDREFSRNPQREIAETIDRLKRI